MEKLPKEERKRMKDLARFARDPYVREYFGTYSRLSIVLPRIFWELGGEEWRKKGKEILMRRFNPRQYFEELHHGRPASEFLIMLLRRKDIDAALKKYPELIKIPPLLPTHPKFDELRDKGIVKDVVFNPFTEYYLKLINLVLRRRYPLYYDPWVDDVWARRLTREKGYRQLGRTVDPIERMKNTYQKFHDALDHFLRTGILKYEDLYEIYKTHKELEYDMNEFVLWRVVGKNLKEGGIRSAWKKNIDQLAEDIKKAEEEYTVFQEAHEMLGAGISILFEPILRMADDEKGKKREEPTFSKVIAKKATIIPYRIPESVSKKAKEWLKRAMEENKIPINIESADLRDIARTFLEELKRMNRALQKYA